MRPVPSEYTVKVRRRAQSNTEQLKANVAANLAAFAEVYPEHAKSWDRSIADVLRQFDTMFPSDLSCVAALMGMDTGQLLVPLCGLAIVVSARHEST